MTLSISQNKASDNRKSRKLNNDILYIVMPAYNEQEVIGQVLEDWYPKVSDKGEGSALVIADTGSTDNTHQLILDFKKTHPRVQILSSTDKQHGPKVISLYKKAISDNVDYVFQTDSDGQTVPSDFDKFWESRNNYDAIIGNRINRGDGWFRSFVEKVCCFCIKVYMRLDVKDSNAPFRLIKVSALKKFINLIPNNHVLPNILVTLYLKCLNYEVKFYDVKFLSREGGKSMYDLKRIISYGFKTLKDMHTIKKWNKKNINEND